MQGLTPLLRRLGAGPGPLTADFLTRRDTGRIQRAEKKEEEVSKRRRKAQRGQQRLAEERNIEAEGVSYASGAF